MKKVQYQNTLKLMFYDQQKANGSHESNNKRNDQRNKSLIHLDWECKLTNIREKFLPDFETLEKKSFHRIRKSIAFYLLFVFLLIDLGRLLCLLMKL